ncbi:hypothetical protein ACNSOO_00720 [Aliarcobacter lanthieri]|uniref:hypothetical protein n=1 Tax=Aliarcobacter lanthieri TaxID=1355374 RepID=UPI003AAEDF08
MSKYFWNTIIILAFISLIILIFALINQEKTQKDFIQKTPITERFQEILTDTIKQNIEKYQNEILENLEITKVNIDENIDKNINRVFDNLIENNLDKYLDFHYSILGEYTQLFAFAFGDINKIINEKLLGKDFEKNINQLSIDIVNSSYLKIEEHLKNTQKIATKDVDLELNKNSLDNLKLNIENNLKTNLIDMKATVIAGAIATKLTISITSKISAKIALKSAGKTAAKLTTSTTAASGGIACGFAAPICGIAFGTIAWFGTDAIVINVDEYINKEDFKEEIIEALNEAKLELKEQYKPIIDELYKISNEYQEKLKTTQTLEKKRIIDNF